MAKVNEIKFGDRVSNGTITGQAVYGIKEAGEWFVCVQVSPRNTQMIPMSELRIAQ